jgi:hypothetical protein
MKENYENTLDSVVEKLKESEVISKSMRSALEEREIEIAHLRA